VDRAIELGRWEAEVQLEDGGVMEGTVATLPRRSVVFNTGMVLHGWIDLINAGHTEFMEPAARAARALVNRHRHDGTWDLAMEFAGIPHTYNSRVAWAMLRWSCLVEDTGCRRAALRHLDWVLSRQTSTGWFHDCSFRPHALPSTHSLAYTMRGLLESAFLSSRSDYLDAARQAADQLLQIMSPSGRLAANYSHTWQPAARHECLTGTAQVGGVLLRLYELTGEARYIDGGARAISHVAHRQVMTGSPNRRGAIAGSHPIWGRYAPLQYPNWAAKFLADALMLCGAVSARP
jgi:hypothetical protein